MIAVSTTLVLIFLIILVGLQILTIFYLFKWLSSLNVKIIETDAAIATLFTRLNEQISELVGSSGILEPPNPIQAIFAQFLGNAMEKNTSINNRNTLGQFVGEQNGKSKIEKENS